MVVVVVVVVEVVVEVVVVIVVVVVVVAVRVAAATVLIITVVVSCNPCFHSVSLCKLMQIVQCTMVFASCNTAVCLLSGKCCWADPNFWCVD